MLEKKDRVSVSKGGHKQKLELAKVFVTCKNFILLMKCSSKCCAGCRCNGLGLNLQRPDEINFVLP